MTNALLTDYKLIHRNASKQIAKAFANITSAKQYGQNTSYQLHLWHNLTALQEMYQTISFNKLYQVDENQYCLVLGSAHERIYFWTNEVIDTPAEVNLEVIEPTVAPVDEIELQEMSQPEEIKAVTKTARKTQEFTGTVTEAKLVEATVYGIDYSAKERYAKALKVTLQTKDGRTVQFYSPSIQVVISCPAGCPIAVVICEENDWIKKVQRQGEGKVVGENIESRLKLGDLVTVSGRIKASYNNGKSVTINHLKFIELVPFGGQLPQKEYVYNPGDYLITYNAEGEHIRSEHKANGGFSILAGDRLDEVLEKGHSFHVPQTTIESLQDNPSNPDSYWLNQLLRTQETYALACWLDSRREKPVVKKKVTASVN